MYLYSPSTKSFYNFIINRNIPDDVIEITDNEHQMLLQALNNGKDVIVEDGRYVIVDKAPAKPTWESIRAKRNTLLKNTDYTQLLDWPGNKVAWFNYRKELRELPQKFKNPEDVVWPTPPSE